MKFYHNPVLKAESLNALQLKQGGLFVDCTLGGGGHSEAILQSGHALQLIGLDRDHEALDHANKRLDEYDNFRSIHTPFGLISDYFKEGELSGILMDLGISSRQIDNGARGFSYRNSDYVDLRMDQSQGTSAVDWLLETPADEIVKVFKRNADMRSTYKFIMRLKEFSQEGYLKMSDFTALVRQKFPKMKDQDGLCARLLQAIRMEINHEMDDVIHALNSSKDLLKPGGRLVVITYHSVEDRIVKHTMREMEKSCICPPRMPICQCGGEHQYFQRLTRKPGLPLEEEIRLNPRARSAKLRVYERVHK